MLAMLLSQTLGIPFEMCSIALCLFSSFPLAIMYARVPKSQGEVYKHLFSIASTTVMFMLAFSLNNLFDMFLATSYTWLITRFFPRSRWAPIVCFAVLMGHMSYIHLAVQIWYRDDPSVYDASSTMMVLVMKLSSFAWSYYDGQQPKDELSEDQKAFAVFQHPSFIELFGYATFFNGVWVGPAFEFRTYKQFIDEDVPYLIVI